MKLIANIVLACVASWFGAINAQAQEPDGKLVGAPMGETETEWAIKRINVNF